MKFVVYLYYLIYKFWYAFGAFFYMHSPFKPKDIDEQTCKSDMRRDTCSDVWQWVYAGDICYYACILRLLYLAGFKQIKLLLDDSCIFIIGGIFLCISFALDRLIPERRSWGGERFEEFSNFGFGQKLLYGTVAVILFWLPVVVIWKSM